MPIVEPKLVPVELVGISSTMVLEKNVPKKVDGNVKLEVWRVSIGTKENSNRIKILIDTPHPGTGEGIQVLQKEKIRIRKVNLELTIVGKKEEWIIRINVLCRTVNLKDEDGIVIRILVTIEVVDHWVIFIWEVHPN